MNIHLKMIYTLKTWFVFTIIMQQASGVAIKNVSAPSVIESGMDLFLDCDFEYQEVEAKQLDLKWYFNGSSTPIYQWVPAMNFGPQVIDTRFKDKVDLTYQIDESDQFKKYRAIRILNPDQSFSGIYKCKISSFVDEDFGQQDVLVFVPPSHINIETQTKENEENGRITIICSVKSVFPMPSVTLSWADGSDIGPEEDQTRKEVENGGLL